MFSQDKEGNRDAVFISGDSNITLKYKDEIVERCTAFTYVQNPDWKNI